MTAAMVCELGDAKELKYETDFAVPELLPRHAVVKNMFSGFNFIYMYFCKGLYKHDTPFVVGQEGARKVVSINAEAKSSTSIQVSDHVAYMVLGSYADYSMVPINKIIPIPPKLGLDLPIACIIQELMVHYHVTLVYVNLIQPGEKFLINSIGSGTCQWVAQMEEM